VGTGLSIVAVRNYRNLGLTSSILGLKELNSNPGMLLLISIMGGVDVDELDSSQTYESMMREGEM
jgi:hypothetical protein